MRFLSLFIKKDRILIRIGSWNLLISSDAYWLRLLNPFFEYEKEISQFIKKLTFNFNFIDIGANIGYWTLYCAQLNMVKEIIAIEPNPSCHYILNENILINNLKNVTCINKAIGSRLGLSEIDFYVPKNKGGHAGGSLIKSSKNTVSFKVQTTSVESCLLHLREKDIPIIFKIDVEGLEIEVLKQIDFLPSNNIIIYEDHGKDLHHTATAFLLAHNYFVFFMSVELHRIKFISDLNTHKKNKRVGYNFLAFKSVEFLDSFLK